MDALGFFAAVFLGWPAILVAIALQVAGLHLQRWPLVLAGALVAAPFALLYLSAGNASVGILVAVLNFASVAFVWRGHRNLAIACAAPFWLVTLALGFVVATQPWPI